MTHGYVAARDQRKLGAVRPFLANMTALARARRTGALLTGLAVIGGAASAVAATPESGEVSKANPRVEWTGKVANSYFNRLPMLLADLAGQGAAVPCGQAAGTCDSFALKVADSDDLTITADAPESTSQTGDAGSQVSLRITKPDGSKEIHTTESAGASPEKPLVVKIKKAPAGDYTIEYFNYFYGSSIPYNASATLGKPAAVGAPEAPVVTAPGTPTAPTTSDTPVATTVELSAKVGKASARKLNKKRKLSASITVSREVKTLTATLKSGSKAIAKGSLGSFSGTRTVSLKLAKKLKKGNYTLAVVATDPAGATVAKTFAVKVAK